ncbi:hypothetical protein C2I18_21980 [Paenibacillus sp. PK3_47]|uniref:hypothetical protein n=1 Tax=Paenibacillus sp. PK3_47 TaxID=2072642 RepID=UPI00201DF059|nr:hypothetical protein [Paenibacillus sp. PK3_47]UQZ35965.1 hypothetical protein C2I18_21980 [Paenibacillus sp. PK3_47]
MQTKRHTVIEPEDLYAFVKEEIGQFRVLSDLRPGSSRTGVWKLQSGINQQFYYLKTYSRKQRWQPEVYAYNHWVHILQPYVPRLIGISEGESWQGILMTEIGGTIMRETSLTHAASYIAYSKAGELTRLLHDTYTGDWFGRPDLNGNPVEVYRHTDPVTYIRSTLSEIIFKCREKQLLLPNELEQAEWALRILVFLKAAGPYPSTGIQHPVTGWSIITGSFPE